MPKFKFEITNHVDDTRIIEVTANTRVQAVNLLNAMYSKNMGYDYTYIENENNSLDNITSNCGYLLIIFFII